MNDFERVLEAKHKTRSEAVQRKQAKDKCGIFYVSESLAEQNLVFAVFAKAQPIQLWHLLCVFGRLANKV